MRRHYRRWMRLHPKEDKNVANASLVLAKMTNIHHSQMPSDQPKTQDQNASLSRYLVVFTPSRRIIFDDISFVLISCNIQQRKHYYCFIREKATFLNNTNPPPSAALDKVWRYKTTCLSTRCLHLILYKMSDIDILRSQMVFAKCWFQGRDPGWNQQHKNIQ